MFLPKQKRKPKMITFRNSSTDQLSRHCFKVILPFYSCRNSLSVHKASKYSLWAHQLTALTFRLIMIWYPKGYLCILGYHNNKWIVWNGHFCIAFLRTPVKGALCNIVAVHDIDAVRKWKTDCSVSLLHLCSVYHCVIV